MTKHSFFDSLLLETSRSAMNRRRFLTLTATSMAGFNVARENKVRAAEPSTAASDFKRRIKLGVVGCGGRGGWIARLFQQHGGFVMHAVADYFPAVAKQCGDALGVEAARRFATLSGYRRVIESGVEAIALETPPYFFPEHARAAVEAGLHLYMAKPVAVDVPGCLAIEEAAKQARIKQRVFLVDYQIPTDPHNQAVVKMIQAGEIGRVLALNSHYFAGQFPDPPLTATPESRFRGLVWCNDVVLGGGYHVNACIHAVDAALWVAGQRPLAALGLSRCGRLEPHGDSHDVFELLFEFPNGLVMSHRGKHLNNLLNFDVICQVLGETGYAQLTYGGKAFLKGREDGHEGEVQNLYEAGARRNIDKFYQSIVGNDFTNDTAPRAVDGALTTILGREAGRRRSRITLAESLQERKRLEVDLTGLRS